MRGGNYRKNMGLKNIIFFLWVGGAGMRRSNVNFVVLSLSFNLYLGIDARLVNLDCQVPRAFTHQAILPACFGLYKIKMNSLLEETGGYFLLHRDRQELKYAGSAGWHCNAYSPSVFPSDLHLATGVDNLRFNAEGNRF